MVERWTGNTEIIRSNLIEGNFFYASVIFSLAFDTNIAKFVDAKKIPRIMVYFTVIAEEKINKIKVF